jgi:hypothetical protein
MEQWPGEKNGTAYQAVMWLFSALLRFFNKSFIYFSSVRSLINWQHFFRFACSRSPGQISMGIFQHIDAGGKLFPGAFFKDFHHYTSKYFIFGPGLSGALPKKSEPQPNNLNFCWKKLEICYLCHPLKSG